MPELTRLQSVAPPPVITKVEDKEKTSLPAPKAIDPRLALELRVRWLEAIVYGAKQQAHEASSSSSSSASTTAVSGSKSNPLLQSRPSPPAKARLRDQLGLKDGETLVRLAENVQQRLEVVVESNEGLKKFMGHYDQHAQYLTSAFAMSGVVEDASPYAGMTPDEIDAFLVEMEPDVRAADRDMQEIEALVKKGVVGAGRLPGHAKLQPRLDAVIAANKADLELVAALEQRITAVMQKHARSVDALSELFVSWDDALTMAEDSIVEIENDKKERRRLGLE